jgi:DEAD/DEAH box helicase domain-containing protein
MNITQLIDYLQNQSSFMENVRLWMKVDSVPGSYADYPESLDGRLVDACRKRGVERLFSHQRDAIDSIARGNDTVVVTPTASGKTLCYNLPVLDAMMRDIEARALYLFPTKALSQDQMSELHDLIGGTGVSVKTFTFDGDTPASARRAIKAAGNIVITNPDMLHSGILPHHPVWIKLFENLKFVVIDEIHSYRGVFGSHFANVMRRLRRVCRFYGSNPVFICCSATIKNPKEHAEGLTGRQFTLVDKSGAPRGERHYVIYNPPVVNYDLGIRASAVKEAAKVGAILLRTKSPPSSSHGADCAWRSSIRTFASAARACRYRPTAAATFQTSGAPSSAGSASGASPALFRPTRLSSASTSACWTPPSPWDILAPSRRCTSSSGEAAVAARPRSRS